MKKLVGALTVLSASALVLAGCAAPAASGEATGVRVTATTNVYGSLVEQIGGDRVDVNTIITSASQDPHSYEATARDRLSVQDAELVVMNGGGYDAFIEDLIEGRDLDTLAAVDFSHAGETEEEHTEEGHHHDHAEEEHAEEGDEHAGHGHITGFNEHVWFDPHTMIHVVEGIRDELAELDPEGANGFEGPAADIIADLETAEEELAVLGSEVGELDVFITEPLPGYLATAAGLHDIAPEGFASAVEEGSDVAPATLLAALTVIESGEVSAVLTNAQTGGAETDRIEQAATDAGIPVVAFTELLEDGSSYSEWMADAISNLADALRS